MVGGASLVGRAPLTRVPLWWGCPSDAGAPLVGVPLWWGCPSDTGAPLVGAPLLFHPQGAFLHMCKCLPCPKGRKYVALISLRQGLAPPSLR